MQYTSVKQIFQLTPENQDIIVQGWVRTFRSNRFVNINDGSTLHALQIVVDFERFPEDLLGRINTGACIKVSGKLVPSQGSGQKVEVLAEQIEVLGDCDPSVYPMQPRKHSLEFLRSKAHLRLRTNTFSAVFRIRHALSFAIHQYFHEHGFYNLHTPIITGSDAEGAGEMFRVSTLPINDVPLKEDQTIDWGADFFGKQTHLTVSGQLEAEVGALALGKVYTFGPTFRAENSNTSRHLAEFWMIEPEVAFADIDDLADLAQDFVQSIIGFVLDNCEDDIKYLHDRIEQEEKNMKKEERRSMSLIDTLTFVLDNDFERITYTEAVDILLQSKPYKKKKFQYPVEWGNDLQSEHERYLVEKKFQKPVIVKNYPKEIKAFYMRANEDNKTVAAMDILFPGIGEVVGGSQREERMDFIKKRMQEMNIPEEELWWYLELRAFGTAPHSGFGLGLERMLQFITGMNNIRDVILFPRFPKSAEF